MSEDKIKNHHAKREVFKEENVSRKEYQKRESIFRIKYGRDPDWGESWVLKGNRRKGRTYREGMKRNSLPVFLDEWTDDEWTAMSPVEKEKSKQAKRAYQKRVRAYRERLDLEVAKEEKRKEKARTAVLGSKNAKLSRKAKLMPQVLAMVELHYSRAYIAKRVGVARATITEWIKDMGILVDERVVSDDPNCGLKVDANKQSSEAKKMLEELSFGHKFTPEERYKLDRQDLEHKTLAHRKRIEKEEMNKDMPKSLHVDSASSGDIVPSVDVISGSSPAEKYSSFMAQALSLKMKHALENLPAPQDYRDVKILDDIISKHLGIGKTNAGLAVNGNSSLSIDINVLNAKNRPRGMVVEAELEEDRETIKRDIKDFAKGIEQIEEEEIAKVVVVDEEVVDF